MATYTGPYTLRPTSNLAPGGNTEFDVQEATIIVDPYTVSSSGIVINGPCLVTGMTCVAGTSATLTLYNATSAAGQMIFPAFVHTLGVPIDFQFPIRCNIGLYGSLGGSTSGIFTVQARA
jgi:hypothetical protein